MNIGKKMKAAVHFNEDGKEKILSGDLVEHSGRDAIIIFNPVVDGKSLGKESAVIIPIGQVRFVLFPNGKDILS